MNDSPSNSPRRFRFSMGAMLLWLAIGGLAANSFRLSHRMEAIIQERDSQQQELDALRPLPAAEVARQFEENATLGPISVSVKDVRYSPESDSYKIDFSWTDASTKLTWFTDIKLQSDGYGTYYGVIRNDPFTKPLGHESFTVTVKRPSPLAQ